MGSGHTERKVAHRRHSARVIRHRERKRQKRIGWRRRKLAAEIAEARRRIKSPRQRYVPGRLRSPFVDAIKTNFPPTLDFVKATDRTVRFFNSLKLRTVFRPAQICYIDISDCKEISPSAVLVLIAAVDRAMVVAIQSGYDLSFRGRRAENPKVDEILGAVGYYEHFQHLPWTPPSGFTKVFVAKETGFNVDGVLAKKIAEDLSAEVRFEMTHRRALRVAIVECMNNVLQHAYPDDYPEPAIQDQWWVYASKDPATHEISICFYDQGVGIPTTIRTRANLPKPERTDEEIIVDAVARGMHSRSEKSTRGKGLPTLKAFVDEFAFGELVIVSGSSLCIFRKGKEPETRRLQLNTGGTLVVWTLKC